LTRGYQRIFLLKNIVVENAFSKKSKFIFKFVRTNITDKLN